MVMVLIILSINIVYVSFFTIRMILTLKGQKYLASAISSVEVIVYVIGLGLVLDNLGEIQNLIAYAVGYAIGVLVGSKIEEMLALGYVTVQVITKESDKPIAKLLRDSGYGVTSWMANGRDGNRLMMEILTRRKDQSDLYHQILVFDQNAFIVSHEPKHFRGGFWLNSLKKHPNHNEEDGKVMTEEHLPGISEESIEGFKEETYTEGQIYTEEQINNKVQALNEIDSSEHEQTQHQNKYTHSNQHDHHMLKSS